MALTAPAILHAKVDVNALGDAQIVAAVAAKKIRVTHYVIQPDQALGAQWKSAATAKSGVMNLAPLGGIAASGDAWAPLLETGTNEALILAVTGPATVHIGGQVSYFLE